MTIYAQIQGDKIISVFGSPQDPEVWPGIVEMEEGNHLYLDFLASTSPSAADTALSTRDSLLAIATLRIDPLQDAVDLEDATDEEITALTDWKRYRVNLNRITEQLGFPSDVGWPVPPE
ncbi:tail fiber assembly protein [Pseudomonas plecoglossicida]|uniref:tail fiber assembly protein n=1 Tax=Pseudomonas plecoglossicida TaxID=70775 RepID=UPI003D1A91B2